MAMDIFSAAKAGNETEVAKLLQQDPALCHATGEYGGRPLLVAAKQGHMGVVRLLLEAMGGEGVNNSDKAWWTALHYAANAGHAQVVAMLLEHGASPHMQDRDTVTPLMCAAGHPDVLRRLLPHMEGLQNTEGVGINYMDCGGATVLRHAANAGCVESIRLLVEHGSGPGRPDHEGVTPLMIAAESGHLEAVQVLVEASGGRAVDYSDHQGWTALCYAASSGQKGVVEWLMEQGAQPTLKARDGTTFLMLAARGGLTDLARRVLEEKGTEELELRNDKGERALHLAASGGREEMVTLLLDQGAQPHALTGTGKTALVEAADSGHAGVVRILLSHPRAQGQGPEEREKQLGKALCKTASARHEEVVRVLLEHGASAFKADAGRRIPLQSAAWGGSVGVLLLLLEAMKGEGLEDRNRWGLTALYSAAHQGHVEVVAVLLEHGAEPLVVTNDGETPLMAAASGHHEDVVRILLQHMGGRGLDAAEKNGRTALHLAARGGVEPGVVRALLRAGADASVTDRAGKTPRARAEECDRARCVYVLEWWRDEWKSDMLDHARYMDGAFHTHEKDPHAPLAAVFQARVDRGVELPRVHLRTEAQGGKGEGQEEMDKCCGLVCFVVKGCPDEIFTHIMAYLPPPRG